MTSIRLLAKQQEELMAHLHCGDGLEAIAFALCGRLKNNNDNFIIVHRIYLMPYSDCKRKPDSVSWETEKIEHLLSEAADSKFSIIKFHSHPYGKSSFSDLDDISDLNFFESVYSWVDDEFPHASVIIYNDGSMKAREITSDGNLKPINNISIVGEDLQKYQFDKLLSDFKVDPSQDRTSQAFGDKTIQTLNNLKVTVVGCSGTGSPTIEQLARLGVGELVLIDPDQVEITNLNRIVGSTFKDAEEKLFKVDVLKKQISKMGLNTKVTVFRSNLQENRAAINEAASSDFIIGTVDSAEGRHYLNLISTYYIIPYIDVGVKLIADNKGGVDSINGNIHYCYPGIESLQERGVFNSTQLEAEEIKRKSDDEFENRRAYFGNVNVSSPAVISVNFLLSSFAVNEFLARIHPYRYEPNKKFNSSCVNLTNWDITYSEVGETSSRMYSKLQGVGEKEPGIRLE
ncbi:ThiF family adenylyltransferase [Leeuwenhoekiella sp. LLG6367-2.1]|uniref:ThiF family adenylyltransferase n=1 Tax=Leeuwenhoekiella sp. LLG6367-2.1 TaxID=3160833 RepID=UPI00386B7D85